MAPYVLRPGDSLATLAARRGFDPDTVWNDPANNELRKLRSDPEVLAPCDIIYLPERKAKWMSLNIGQVNLFTTTVATLFARLRCIDVDGRAVAGEAFVITSLDPPVRGTTGADGAIDLEIPANERVVRIHFPNAGFDLLASTGGLDPVTELSGLAQRLAALDLALPPPPVIDPDASAIVADEYRAAVLGDFQRKQGLTVTCELDDATRQALTEAHGA